MESLTNQGRDNMMAHAQIVTLPTGQPLEEECSLRDQVDEILEKHQEDITSMLTKWIMFWTDFGSRTLNLDNCPILLSKIDRKFAIEWLRGEGFTVRAPKILGRAVIELEVKE